MNRIGPIGIAFATGVLLLCIATGPAPAAAETASTVTAAKQEAPCDCGCKECGQKPCGHHGHRHGGMMMKESMGKMKEHLEAMRKAVADLREREKTLEASVGSDPFRAAVLDQLKKLTDLQASHLEHMEEMMGGMHGGVGRTPPEPGK